MPEDYYAGKVREALATAPDLVYVSTYFPEGARDRQRRSRRRASGRGASWASPTWTTASWRPRPWRRRSAARSAAWSPPARCPRPAGTCGSTGPPSASARASGARSTTTRRGCCSTPSSGRAASGSARSPRPCARPRGYRGPTGTISIDPRTGYRTVVPVNILDRQRAQDVRDRPVAGRSSVRLWRSPAAAGYGRAGAPGAIGPPEDGDTRWPDDLTSGRRCSPSPWAWRPSCPRRRRRRPGGRTSVIPTTRGRGRRRGTPVRSRRRPARPGSATPSSRSRATAATTCGHYSLTLDYEPSTRALRGSAVITARATQDLSRFDLDLRGFALSDVRVDGRPAVFTRDGQELVITPARAIRKRSAFVVSLSYAGVPEVVTDPDGSIEGWVPDRGRGVRRGRAPGLAVVVPGQRQPARQGHLRRRRSPCPLGLTAMSNGVLAATWSRGGRTTWAWRESSPMATYLATATLGRFDAHALDGVAGVPSYVAVDPTQAADGGLGAGEAPGRWWATTRRLFGRYPFDAVGAIVDDAPEVGYALESQTKPNFDRAPRRAHPGARDRPPVVRELGDPHGVARHLAQRGLRLLRRVALGRAHRPVHRAGGLRRPLRRARGLRACGARRRPASRTRPSSSPAASTTAGR